MNKKLTTPFYGKEQIENDIINQNGQSTPLQLTMLKLDDLRLIVNELIKKGTSDRYEGTTLISDADGEIIRKAFWTFQKEIEHMNIDY